MSRIVPDMEGFDQPCIAQKHATIYADSVDGLCSEENATASPSHLKKTRMVYPPWNFICFLIIQISHTPSFRLFLDLVAVFHQSR